MQIHVSDHREADAAWRLLASVPDDRFQPVDLHMAGHGLLYTVIRDEDGRQTTAPAAAQPGHSSPA